jgi:hypothetical protein
MSPYEALVFDLGGVIVAHDNAVLYAQLVSRCDREWSVEDVQAIVGLPRWGTGEGSISELHAQLRETAGYAASWATFVEDWSCHFTMDGSMLAFLQDLRRSHRVMLFSNTNKEHWDHVDGLAGGVLKTLEAYLSHEIGRRGVQQRSGTSSAAERSRCPWVTRGGAASGYASCGQGPAEGTEASERPRWRQVIRTARPYRRR